MPNTIRVRALRLEKTPYKMNLLCKGEQKELVLNLYHHQIEALTAPPHQNLLVTAKTGTGKTATAVLGLMAHGQKAVFVYPTNALLRNQFQSLVRIFSDWLGLRIFVPNQIRPLMQPIGNDGEEHTPKSYAESDVLLAPIDSAILQQFDRRTKGQALQDILTQARDFPGFAFLLVNPDTLFYLLATRYRGSLLMWQDLQSFPALVVDEFHSYSGVVLSNVLHLLAFGRRYGMFKRLLFLSATPSTEIENLLERFFGQSQQIVCAKGVDNEQTIPALHETTVDLSLVEEHPAALVDAVVDVVKQRMELIQGCKKSSQFLTVPSVVIVNSVIDAINISKRIEGLGLQVVPYHGLMSKAHRDKYLGKADVVVGTSAIELGVDFDCTLLIMEAGDLPSFIQRFGRASRHRPSEVVVLAPINILRRMENLEKIGTPVDRDEFERAVSTAYPDRPQHAWFVTTAFGVLSLHLLKETLLDLVEKSGRTSRADIEHLKREIDADYTAILQQLFTTDSERMRLRVNNFTRAGWARAYQKIASLRNSVPSIRVFDMQELEHSRFPIYEADLLKLLRHATPATSVGKTFIRDIAPKLARMGISDADVLGTRLVQNYQYRYRIEGSFVNASRNTEGEKDCGIQENNFRDSDQALIIRRKDQVSDLMDGHVFLIVDRETREHFDWRVSFVPFDQVKDHFIVFDGDALLCRAWQEVRSQQGN